MTRVRSSPFGWRTIVLTLFLGDLLSALVGAFLAVLLWSALPTDFVPTPLLPQWIVGSTIAWLLALSFLDGYDIVAPTFWRAMPGIVARAFLVVALVTAAVFFTVPFLFPRGVGILAPLVVMIVLVVWRLVFAKSIRASGLRRRVLLLGADEACQRLAQLLLASRTGISYEPVAFLSAADDAPEQLFGLPVLRGTEKLWEIVRESRVDEIVVGSEEAIVSVGQVALVECFARGVTASSAVALYEALTGRVLVSSLGPTWFAQIPTDPHRPYLLAKRAVDFLIVLALAPIWVLLAVVVAFAVLVGSGAPAMFRQVRVGERGVPFVIHKFRTMREGSETEGARFADVGDERRTRLGRVLRRTHLDELPQLWDVLLGHMSLIGPRPERPEFVDRLRAAMPLYEARFLVKPGLTGWAQVRLPYAANIEESLMKLEYDLYYVKHVGPLLDLSIALRTIGRLLELSGR